MKTEPLQPDPLDPRSSLEDAKALHEAGHAVMAYRLGHTVELLTVESGTMPDGTVFGGRCASYPPGRYDGCPPKNPQEARVEALCYAAGWAAQVVAGDSSEHALRGQTLDFGSIREIAEDWFANDPPEQFLSGIKNEALAIMRQPENRAAVEAVAQMLLALGEMCGYETAMTIRSAELLAATEQNRRTQ